MRTSVDVHNFLVERETPHEVVTTRGRLRSPERIAAVLDLPPGVVGKVTVLEGPSGPIAVVCPSDRECDAKRVARVLHTKPLETTSDERASELTGYLPESIPPAGLPDGFKSVVDRALAQDEVMYFPGGEARAVLKIRGKDLVRSIGAKVGSVSVPSVSGAARRPKTRR